ncbi:hypothetical protein FN846DRAFT_1025755 [Sphaerosporella brunnea]|uniref:Uncharacterized protein n=1 Tax=Sphaerosporella brunnea TaxID=1250544 RepID=A0A5J5EDT6_9PEZI|nr:hypothetical protein FN846DRAFT_1025755 [Sphaerosporella brunnea]
MVGGCGGCGGGGGGGGSGGGGGGGSGCCNGPLARPTTCWDDAQEQSLNALPTRDPRTEDGPIENPVAAKRVSEQAMRCVWRSMGAVVCFSKLLLLALETRASGHRVRATPSSSTKNNNNN